MSEWNLLRTCSRRILSTLALSSSCFRSLHCAHADSIDVKHHSCSMKTHQRMAERESYSSELTDHSRSRRFKFDSLVCSSRCFSNCISTCSLASWTLVNTRQRTSSCTTDLCRLATFPTTFNNWVFNGNTKTILSTVTRSNCMGLSEETYMIWYSTSKAVFSK